MRGQKCILKPTMKAALFRTDCSFPTVESSRLAIDAHSQGTGARSLVRWPPQFGLSVLLSGLFLANLGHAYGPGCPYGTPEPAVLADPTNVTMQIGRAHV